MTLEYNSRFENEDKYQYRKWVGYITPDGVPYHYSTPWFSGHSYQNECTILFSEYFFYESVGGDIRWIDREPYSDTESFMKAFRQKRLESLPKDLALYQRAVLRTISPSRDGEFYLKNNLSLKLCQFFENCYQNENFLEAYGRDAKILDEFAWMNMQPFREEDDYVHTYPNYWRASILSFFKDVMVMYLGYDSVEVQKSKTICTSYPNVNERFYNYLLNGFQIQKLTRMYYNEEKKMYIPQPIEYSTEKEEILGQEIEAIRRRVPKEEIYHYYR